MPTPLLSSAEVSAALATLPGWSSGGGRLRRAYSFADFVDAFSFMTAAALRIQERDHHPEWSNVYGTVRIRLSTHDAGGITAKDVDLARTLEALAARWSPR